MSCRYKTGKVRHAYAAWHDGKVLPGCKNYANEEGDKWSEADFKPLLPRLEDAFGFTDGARLVKGHFSVPVEWLDLEELTDDHAIFKVWPTEQNRIAATHLMGMEDLAWEKVEAGKYYMSRAQYDACNDQL